jgi:hypothetical protein
VRPLLCAALALSVAAAGCGTARPAMPAACLNGSSAMQAALAGAPAEVKMDGVRLSECLIPSGDAAPLEAFGGTAIDVAIKLAARARRGDHRAALQLGYLRGALTRGADSGLHAELLRRFDQELLRVDRHSPAFRRGEAAGRERG